MKCHFHEVTFSADCGKFLYFPIIMNIPQSHPVNFCSLTLSMRLKGRTTDSNRQRYVRCFVMMLRPRPQLLGCDHKEEAVVTVKN